MNRSVHSNTTAAGPEGSRRLPVEAIRLWGVHTVIGSAVLSCAVVAGAHWWGPGWAITASWIIAGVVLLFGILDLLVLNRIKHRYYAYTVDASEVSVTQGLLLRTSMTLAVPQILSIHVIRGPLQRLMGLASVRFTCVVDSETLGPVTVAEAERIKQTVLAGLEQRRAESLAGSTSPRAAGTDGRARLQEVAA